MCSSGPGSSRLELEINVLTAPSSSVPGDCGLLGWLTGHRLVRREVGRMPGVRQRESCKRSDYWPHFSPTNSFPQVGEPSPVTAPTGVSLSRTSVRTLPLVLQVSHRLSSSQASKATQKEPTLISSPVPAQRDSQFKVERLVRGEVTARSVGTEGRVCPPSVSVPTAPSQTSPGTSVREPPSVTVLA